MKKTFSSRDSKEVLLYRACIKKGCIVMSSSHISPSHIMDSLDISYRTFPQKTLCMCVYMCMYVHTRMLNISYRVQSLSRV